jgi:hypothetical protein
MARKKKTLMDFRCENCGKPQPIDETKSNENWQIYDCHAVCECGGKFVLHIDGVKI